HNGFFGSPGNVDLANQASSVVPGNCFLHNLDRGGTLTSDPPAIEQVDGTCGGPAPGDPALAGQLVCASGAPQAIGVPTPGPDTPATHYPQTTHVRLLPLPAQRSMSNPCRGVPSNPWCSPQPNGSNAGARGATL